MAKVTKSVTVPVEIWLAFEEKHAGMNFSRWVSEQMERSLKWKQNKRLSEYTKGEKPKPRKPDPLQMTDRAEAEAQARKILEGFGQTDKKLSENLDKIMQRWDDLHDDKT